MADIIHLLPDSVANQIAAGEVIQRPASIVKELVENAVDAGSTEIMVLLKEAGKSRVQVIDNGCGMSDTDARMSFERHATSKIKEANDLFSIRTMGFRGEALASIAAVAQLELKTCKREEKLGTLIKINGSEIEIQEPTSCPSGTNIIVKNLFYNIPARRKFLKSNSTELRHLVIEFQRIALTLPQISFSLYHNDSEIYNLSAVPSIPQRIAGIFGRGILPNLVPVKTDTSIVNIRGHIGKPEFARKTYGEQFFFVNNRFMRHPYFHRAVTAAYEEILPPETIPSYFLYFDIDPENIDINIHPTKTEIKFDDERSIWQILNASIREALGKFNVIPSIDFNTEGSIEIPVLNKDSQANPPQIKVDPGFNPFRDKQNLENWENLYKENPHVEQGKWPNQQEDVNTQNELFQTGSQAQQNLFHFKGKYILSPVKSGLMVIDQKRAHERILYENFLELKSSLRTSAQKSLFPHSLKLNPADYILFKELLPDLNNMGFDIRDLGNNALIVNAYPSKVHINDPVEALEVLLHEYKSTQTNLEKGHKERLAQSLAKASSIPYGKVLSQEEMKDLVDRLFACNSPNYSPGGKPVISIISMEEFEEKFN